MITAHTDAVVEIVAGSKTADGFKSGVASDAGLSDNGEEGLTTSVVHCNADTIGDLTLGQDITVGGLPATVMRSVVDPLGAIVRIEYQLQKPK